VELLQHILNVEYISTLLVARIPLDRVTLPKPNFDPQAQTEFVCTSVQVRSSKQHGNKTHNLHCLRYGKGEGKERKETVGVTKVMTLGSRRFKPNISRKFRRGI
jgi:hypothetical protein